MMQLKALQWIAVTLLFAAFWVQWSALSFGWQAPHWVIYAAFAAQVFFIVVQVVALRRAKAR